MYVTLGIIIITSIVSILAFRRNNLFDYLVSWPYKIWNLKEWYRLLTGGFVHEDFSHLFFNMLVLLLFSGSAEANFSESFFRKGPVLFALMYFSAIIAADLYTLAINKDNYYYRSYGAGGGIAAIIFSSILLHPLGKLTVLFLPVGIPTILIGVVYLAYCFFLDKRSDEHTGHTSYFAGAIFGFVFPILCKPWLVAIFIRQIIGE